jgi:c-di-GMP-binding flagellar brake protein YcgR
MLEEEEMLESPAALPQQEPCTPLPCAASMEAEENAENSAVPYSERRVHARYEVDGDAVLQILSSGTRIACSVLDLSQGGCKLRTRKRFQSGLKIRVELTFKICGIALRFAGVTEWAEGQNLVGIRFVDLTSRRNEMLADVVSEVEAENAAREKKQAAAKFAQEEAARQASEPEPEPEVVEPLLEKAPDSDAEAQPPATAEGRERRAQTRQEVDTFATVFLINIGSKLRGRILDLSLGGCRIRTNERFPVGIYTRVETEFHLDGLPFRLGGVIQAIHDRHHVGIRFLDMSLRKRKQVELLIQEIQELKELRDQKMMAEPNDFIHTRP